MLPMVKMQGTTLLEPVVRATMRLAEVASRPTSPGGIVAPAKKAAAKKAPARKAAAKKAPARKAVAKKAPARKAAARKAPARKSVRRTAKKAAKR
jgi:hypothetical protein